MSVYRVQARRHTYPRLGNEGLSRQAVNWLLPDALFIGIDEDRGQLVSLGLELERYDHQAAINEIAVALERAGYSLFNAEVSEWVDRSVEAMVSTALTVGAASGAVTRKPLVTSVAALIAALLAREVESRMRRLEVVYSFVPSPNGWLLEPITK